jgi:hypothetical protein
MNPNDLIEAYVAEVVRRLPRGQRNDVGYELRALLGEELHAKALELGRTADADMALALLNGFGRPEEVADRYRPAGFEIIPPRLSASFLAWAVGGVALQWAITLPAALTAPGGLSRIGGWWLTAGLAAFWWPGFLVSIAAIATWVQRRMPSATAWTPRRVDRDRINRPLSLAAMAFWLCGASVLIALPWIAHALATTPWRPAGQALAYDETFLRERGPWVLPLWAAGFGLYGMVIVDGRWRPLTRRIAAVLNLLVCALLAWFIVGGPIWRTPTTDGIAKACMALIIVLALADCAAKAWRSRSRLRAPAGAT